jgi:hypothetical protein
MALSRTRTIIENAITVVYALAASGLLVIGVVLLLWALVQCLGSLTLLPSTDVLQNLLKAIGAIVISIAVIDVSKYLIEEEIFRDKELRSPIEARETLTKVFVIISIAVSLEGLVFLFKAGMEDIGSLLYPVTVIAVGVFSIVGLGFYQRLSIHVEEKVIDEDSPR